MKKITHISLPVILAFLTIMLISSCKRDRTEPVDSYDYYPLEVGRYLIYDIKEEVYSAGQANPVRKSWQEKDEVDRISDDEKGVTTYIVSRSRRNLSTENWKKEKEYTIRRYPDKLLTNIDNQTLFSLAFPVNPNVEWNGNSYNSMGEQKYHYEDLNKPVQIGAQSFDKALVVVERNDSSVINRYVGIKHYGLGVGLLSDDQTSFEFCQSEDCIGSGKIESGVHRSKVILEFGKR